MADTLKRLESFPFDSLADGYDSEGYPVYDRAVGAKTLRSAFGEFFADGVFPTPADALHVDAGEGLSVTVQPGMFIINGSIGGVLDEPAVLTVADAPPVGDVPFSVFLRYDNNTQYRSLYIRVAAGAAGGQPPEPEVSAAVREYVLATFTLPSGAADFSGVQVENLKGTGKCPYAAPFESIDVSKVVEDARAGAEKSAQESWAAYEEYLNTYRDLVASAVDGTLAGDLQNRIEAMGTQVDASLAQLRGELLPYMSAEEVGSICQ